MENPQKQKSTREVKLTSKGRPVKVPRRLLPTSSDDDRPHSKKFKSSEDIKKRLLTLKEHLKKVDTKKKSDTVDYNPLKSHNDISSKSMPVINACSSKKSDTCKPSLIEKL